MVRSQDINVIVDVRSIPASKYTPQFNKEIICASLKKNGISYMHLGEEFGARRFDSLDGNNNVNFELAAKTPAFQKGVERLMNGLSKGFRVSLMCSESNPLDCHRFALVSRYFYEHDVDVLHIVKDKETGLISAVPHIKLQNEMIAEYVKKKKIPQVCGPDLFGEGEVTPELQIELAYRQKNIDIAYHQEDVTFEEVRSLVVQSMTGDWCKKCDETNLHRIFIGY